VDTYTVTGYEQAGYCGYPASCIPYGSGPLSVWQKILVGGATIIGLAVVLAPVVAALAPGATVAAATGLTSGAGPALSGAADDPLPGQAAQRVQPFVAGHIWQHSFSSNVGEVGVLAETEAQGTQLLLRNITIYTDKGDQIRGVGVRAFVELKDVVLRQAASQGFESVRMVGERVENSSGLTGHVFDHTFRLER
jgi:hypothetical protein